MELQTAQLSASLPRSLRVARATPPWRRRGCGRAKGDPVHRRDSREYACGSTTACVIATRRCGPPWSGTPAMCCRPADVARAHEEHRELRLRALIEHRNIVRSRRTETPTGSS